MKELVEKRTTKTIRKTSRVEIYHNLDFQNLEVDQVNELGKWTSQQK